MIADLAQKLEEASTAYYNGTPIMSDSVFDQLENQLRKLDPNHPVLLKIGAPTESGWPKHIHTIPMGSLNKAQDAADFQRWFNGLPANTFLFVSDKMDGMACVIHYKNGELISAATRGDGVEGELITRNVRVMQGVPQEIKQQGDVYVKGEVICKKSDFTKYFPGESNPRNTATGTAKRQSSWQKAKHLTFVAYNLTDAGTPHLSRFAEFTELTSLGFITPNNFLVSTPEQVTALMAEYAETTRQSLDYLIDGLVIEINKTSQRESMGSTSLRPNGAIAFKFESEAQWTVLRDVEWQVGSSGRITPVAYFDEVNLNGVRVSKASLHNLARVNTLTLSRDCEILVSRRNDVIPYVEDSSSIANASTLLFKAPDHCPSCSESTQMDGEYLICPNSECPANVMGMMQRWISKLGILHFGDKLLEATIDAKMVATIDDLYRLKEDEVADLLLDGRKVGGSAKRALDSLHANKEISLDEFIGSLGIPLVGRGLMTRVVDAGYDTLDKLKNANANQLAAIPDFGESRAESLVQGLKRHTYLIQKILEAGVTIKAKPIKEITSNVMAGKSVCFTGVRSAELEEAIIAAGGTIASGASKTLTYLVAKDPNAASAKLEKARKLGVKIVSLDEMRKLIG